MASDNRIRIPLDPREHRLLETRAAKAQTTMASVAHDLIKKALAEEKVASGDKRIVALLEQQNEVLRRQNAKLQELLAVSYANLAMQAWIGKHALGAAFDDPCAADAADMFTQMTPSEVCNMALHMGQHMTRTGGDLRSAMATICDLPGVEVTLMGYVDDDDWRGAYDANGNPLSRDSASEENPAE